MIYFEFSFKDMSKFIKLMVPNLGLEETKSIKKVINSNFITDGPVTKLFEKKFAKYVNVRYAVATTSGTSAMELALRILKINDETKLSCHLLLILQLQILYFL